MIFAWFVALVVPALAVIGGAWFVIHLDPGRATAFDERTLLMIQYMLAAAPLVALAIFAFVRVAVPDAVRLSTVMTAAATLAAWGWYHLGAPGVTLPGAGLVLLVSPVALGVLAVVVYLAGLREN